MVGNDIIDLNEARKTSNWKHSRFLEKLFTPKEQNYIQDSQDVFSVIWELWSMKEAAYKLYVQLYPNRFYNPKGFVCALSGRKNRVTYLDFECFVNTKITSKFILSEARLIDSEMTSSFLNFDKISYHFQSETTRNHLLDSISKAYNLSKSNLKIIKSEFGIPKVYYNSKPLNLNVSITHHGNYGAFTIS